MEAARGVSWFTTPETTPRATCPNENFVRFVATNYFEAADRSKIWFVDIGCGSGANTRWLEKQGFSVVAIDPAPQAGGPGFLVEYHETAEEFFPTEVNHGHQYDCIFDINTLCHVEDPPYEAIYKALKPGGKFFSIHPADDTEVNMAGKGYTRLADVLTMRKLLGRGFMRFTIQHKTDWSADNKTKICSWQIVGEK